MLDLYDWKCLLWDPGNGEYSVTIPGNTYVEMGSVGNFTSWDVIHDNLFERREERYKKKLFQFILEDSPWGCGENSLSKSDFPSLCHDKTGAVYELGCASAPGGATATIFIRVKQNDLS